MTSATKSAYHHGNLRQSLIEGAISLINDEGVEQLSLRQVARRAGVSHNAPYRHFADKEALLAAVAEEGFQALYSKMTAAIPSDLSQQLTAIGIAYIQFALDHPSHYRLMFGQYRYDFSQYPSLVKVAGQSFQILVETIMKGQAAGLYRDADPVNMARVAWALVHGQAMLALDNHLQIEPDAWDSYLQFSSKMLREGLASTPEASN